MATRRELAKKFKEGQMVTINNNIDKTVQRHSEDEDGNMRRMIGKRYKIHSISSDRIHINGFMWAPEDLKSAEDPVPLPPKKTNILFDPKELL